MIVEVRRANTRNKGAELMLRAIVAELRPEYRIAAAPRTGPYEERAALGLLQKVDGHRVPDGVVGLVESALPSAARRLLLSKFGLVFDGDVGAILDASGFAYSDQRNLEHSLLTARKLTRAKRGGKPVILLPQALGPFESPAHREAFVRIVDNSDIVYARERMSFRNAVATGCRTDRLRLAPDFTCLLDGAIPPGFTPSNRLALVVPSEKLLTKTPIETRNAYLPFMAMVVDVLREEGFDVCLLVHDRDDAQTANALQARLRAPARVVRHDSALHLKGVIGSARLVVGSRFHALVSALSQGVPALAIGWSHKYEMLFADYDCVDHVVNPLMDRDALTELVRAMAEGSLREQTVAALHRQVTKQREGAREMWSEIKAVLG